MPITSSICCLTWSGSAGQVDLVQYRNDLEPCIERVIDIGQCLRLDTLAGVDHQ